jgi:cytochrome P450
VQPDKDADYNAAFLAEMQRMLARFDALMEQRRALPPTDDLLSRMVHSEAMGNLSPFERISNLALLVVAGNDTTRNSMSGLVEALALYPDQPR